MAAKITAGGLMYTVSVVATRAKVVVSLTCASDRAADQLWTYIDNGNRLALASVSGPDSTEIERRDPTLRAACRRAAVRAWAACQHDLTSMS